MNLKYLIKTILIAFFIYFVSIMLTTFLLRYVMFIPVPIVLAFESSFFLTYLYGQYVIFNSLRKGIQFDKLKQFKVYLYIWLIVMVIMTIINYIVY
ncbi:MAG: hypothetical protein K0Q49_1444 [Haloplasmataceae bacterium]|jgi:hypothetical protein|nr:hypothetical protein [Haloplasmataceae bacterium]